MILHDIPNNSKFIEIPASPLGAKGFFKRDLDIGDVLTGPGCAQKGVCETED